MEKELKEIKEELAELKTRIFNLEYRVKCNDQELNNLKKAFFDLEIESTESSNNYDYYEVPKTTAG